METRSEARLDWTAILVAAAAIVNSYDTLVTLRQLFYQLVVRALITNTLNMYKQLSRVSAAARRRAEFPELLDNNRSIHRYATWSSPRAAALEAAEVYRIDRTIGQRCAIYLAIEKNGLVPQLTDWFGDLGVGIAPLGGYSSESFERTCVEDMSRDGRPVVLIYAGDHDASGQDISRNFQAQIEARGQKLKAMRRIALSPEQVEEFQLPEFPGKETDSRAGSFVARYGKLVQVELDALDPNILRGLYQKEIDKFWDTSTYDETLAREADEREKMLRWARRLK